MENQTGMTEKKSLDKIIEEEPSREELVVA
jgi:hypothetical protein